jgi:hypothetical protein
MVQLIAKRRTHKALSSLGLLGAMSLVLAGAAGASTFKAAIVSSNGSFSAGTLQLEGTTAGSNNCYSTGTGSGGSVTASNVQPCTSGSPIPTGELSSTASSTATTTLTSIGNRNATASTVMTPSCGVAQLADSESSTDWGGTGPNNALPFYGISYQAAGPLSSQAITTDGSSGWIETSTEYTNPESFTVLVWFKTTTANGAILGFSSLQDPWSPTYADRMLWVDPAGKLVWGVYGTANDEIKTAAAVDTGSWVFAAASVGAAGASLDVNGIVVTNAAYTTARNYPGWWTVAWAYLSGWADTPSSDYFNGSLAQLAIIPSQLSAGQVSTIYGESSQSAYAAQINTLSPVNYWPFTDTGSVPYPYAPPGTQDLVDSSGHSNTGTAVGGVTVGATGPTALGTSSAISLDGSTGNVQTVASDSDPFNFSLIAWFKTTSTSGGTIIGFDSSEDTSTPASSDRLLWMDNTGHLVWGIDDAGVKDKITSTSAYNTGTWYMVAVEEETGGGAPGARLYVNDVQVAINAAYTTPQNYNGYWHVGWGYETGWVDAPTSGYFNGSLSEVAYLPSVLSGTQLSTLYGETSVSTLSTYMMSLGPNSYWTLQDSATSICGTTEITVQEKLGATSTCIYPAEPVGTACPVVSASYMLTALGSRSSTVVPIAGSPVTVTVTMKLSAASGVLVAGLHMLPDIALGTQYSSTLWSAGISYPYASVEL